MAFVEYWGQSERILGGAGPREGSWGRGGFTGFLVVPFLGPAEAQTFIMRKLDHSHFPSSKHPPIRQGVCMREDGGKSSMAAQGSVIRTQMRASTGSMTGPSPRYPLQQTGITDYRFGTH